MNPSWKRWVWSIAKWVLAALILFAVGRQFYIDLQRPELAELTVRLDWLALSGALYLAALGFSAWFWHRLLHAFGERPALRTAVRAYFIGHLGKYVPGKAWALLLRGSLVRGPQTRFGVAILSSFYEVLTTMAAGALVAALVFAIAPPEVAGFDLPPLVTGLLLLALCGVPLLPGVFNRIVGRLARRYQHVESFQLPRLRFGTLATGLLMTACGWLLLGLSVWATLQATLPEPPPLTVGTWLHLCASIGLAYVAGFLAVFMPSGVGVREFFLLRLLAFAGPDGLIAAAVLLLRLAWTAAELIFAAVLTCIRPIGAAKVADAEPVRVD